MDFQSQLMLIRKQKNIEYEKYLRETGLKEDIYTSSAKKIQKFIKKKYLFDCINDVNDIPGMYRFRVPITNHHLCYYKENTNDNKLLNLHRAIHQAALGFSTPKILFYYCFDIRQIYYSNDKSVVINNNTFYLQPDDYIHMHNLWHKVNGDTNYSINYLSKMEYYKSLSHDRYKNKEYASVN